MKQMKNKYTILIPVHDLNETNKEYLTNKCINSVINSKKIDYTPNVMIVGNTKTYDELKSLFENYENIEVLKNSGDSSFQGQMNFASKYIKTEYFMFLELDDELNENYLHNFDKYYDELKGAGVLLNILIEVDENDKPQKLTNEMAWSRQFAGEDGELGYINIEQLKNFSEFKLSGSFINTEMFKKIGGLKTNIELSFNYEFFLRVSNNGYKIFVIPKIGCKHVEGRDGSLFKYYMDNMSIKERGFWFNVAKKEYFFNTDREIDKKEIE